MKPHGRPMGPHGAPMGFMGRPWGAHGAPWMGPHGFVKTTRAKEYIRKLPIHRHRAAVTGTRSPDRLPGREGQVAMSILFADQNRAPTVEGTN